MHRDITLSHLLTLVLIGQAQSERPGPARNLTAGVLQRTGFMQGLSLPGKISAHLVSKGCTRDHV